MILVEDDSSEKEEDKLWMDLISRNPAFDLLKEHEEDIYSQRMENYLMIKNNIVLVPFPFDDFSNWKVRPALCLTSEIGKYNHVMIAFISGKVPDNLIDSDVIVRK